MKIQEEYKSADLANIETLKQIVINRFKENNLPLEKIRTGRLTGKDKGIYVYHPNGTTYYQNCREVVEKTENSITYRRFKKAYQVSFISTENLEEFENFLNMTIAEAKMRAKCV